jgi:hypothetical protein
VPRRVKWLSFGWEGLDAEFFENIAELLIHKLHPLAQSLNRTTALGRVFEGKPQMVCHRQEFQRKLLVCVFTEIQEVTLDALSVIIEFRIEPDVLVVLLLGLPRFLIQRLFKLLSLFFCNRR